VNNALTLLYLPSPAISTNTTFPSTLRYPRQGLPIQWMGNRQYDKAADVAKKKNGRDIISAIYSSVTDSS
jgi:hypothetical protein